MEKGKHFKVSKKDIENVIKLAIEKYFVPQKVNVKFSAENNCFIEYCPICNRDLGPFELVNKRCINCGTKIKSKSLEVSDVKD